MWFICSKTGTVLKYFLFFFLLLISPSCKDDPVKPPEEIEPGGRNYDWMIDTLFSGFQTYMVSLWGSSSEDVWICGHDGDNSKRIRHFNGFEWVSVTIPQVNFLYSFNAVEGNEPDNIFFAGMSLHYNPSPPPNFIYSALVAHYFNGNWKTHELSNPDPLFALCYIDDKNLWTGGVNGTLYKFDGTSWTLFPVGEKIFINNLVSLSPNEVYASGHRESSLQGTYYVADYLFCYNGYTWSVIDSNITSNNFTRISFPTVKKNINGTIYGIRDEDFVKKCGSSWEIIKTGIHGQFDGTNEKNIFLANQDVGVLHYNGSDWFRFNELPWLRYYDLEVFEDAVFLLATDGTKSYIVSGRRRSLQ